MKQLLFIVLIIKLGYFNGQTIPTERVYDWPLFGLKDTSTLNFNNIDLNNFSLSSNGIHPNDDIIDSLITIYSSAGAHSPHHVGKEWIAKYKGKFDEGWDVLRARNIESQIKAGIVPAGTRLAKTPDSVPKWDSLTPQQQKIYARQAEVFAAFTEHSDHEAGRLIQAIEDLGELGGAHERSGASERLAAVVEELPVAIAFRED